MEYTIDRYPETINLELTLKCNLKCKMCQRSAEGFTLPELTDMPMKTVENVIPVMRDAKVVWLSGFGEPLMHPELVEIVSKIHEKNQQAVIAFTTNLVLMTPDKIEALIRAGLSRIQVSVDGENEMGHAFSPTPEGVARYQKLLWKRLEELHAAKKTLQVRNPELQFCFVAMKRNIAQLQGIIEQGLAVGLSSIVVQPLRDHDGTMTSEDLYANKEYALPLLTEAKRFAEQHGVEFICRFMDEKMSFTRDRCHFPWNFFHVAVDGQVFMCCEGISAEMNVNTTPAVEIWNSEIYRKLRKELATGALRKKCWDCPLVTPTTKDWAVLSRGLQEMSKEALIEELGVYRKYVSAVHEREDELTRKLSQHEHNHMPQAAAIESGKPLPDGGGRRLERLKNRLFSKK